MPTTLIPHAPGRAFAALSAAAVLAATSPMSPAVPTAQALPMTAPTLAGPPPTHTPLVTGETATVERLAGSDRYSTAAVISARWSGPVDRVYVVSGSRFQEAAVAAAHAGAHGAPVLLTRSDSLPGATARALESLRPAQIVVVGKSSAVSDAVLSRLRGYARSGEVQRIAGHDRYSTSARAAATYPASPERVYLASGEAFPDALAAAALAGAESSPLLLTARDTLSSEVTRELARLAPREVVIIGGEDVISSSVASRAARLSTSGQARRVAGSDRYDTAAIAAERMGTAPDHAYVASGETFPDALVVSALAARDRAPVVFTRPESLPAVTGSVLSRLAPAAITVVGGTDSVSDSVLGQLASLLDRPTEPVEPEPVDPEPVEPEPVEPEPVDPEPVEPEPVEPEPVEPEPVDPEPVDPSHFPDASTTGVPEGVRLTASGSLTITEDGTVIDGLHVRGQIDIYADNVTIRNTLVESSTSGNPVYVDRGTNGTLIENVEIDNLGGGGIGIFMRGSGTIRAVDIHSAEDGIRINSDRVTVERSYIHDMAREDGGHHDSIQIRRGDDVVIRGNNLQSYVAATDDPQNAAIQIGSLSGEDPISNLLVVGNLMNGGNYTINGGGRGEVDSARYADNRFGRDYRFGVAGNLQNSVWEDTNVWHDTGLPVD